MITTSNGVKLKAFKNGRDTEDVKEAEVENKCKASDKGADEEKGSNGASSNTNHNNPQPTIVICQRDRPDNRLKARPRTRDDFRMARGGTMDRRGANIRSRGGGGVSRKVERENESNIVSGGKFQDSLTKGNASENVSSSKYYNDSEGSKHRVEFGYMVPEDSRISKLLRRLSREDDQDKFMTLCKQLQESLMVPENGRYIRRSLDLIVESLLDLLHSGPGPDAKFQAAKCLGRVGYVLEQDFKRYVDWVFSTYAVERNEDVRLLLMKAVLETLKLDEETLKLKEFSSLLMNNLQNALEYTDSPEFLIGTVDVILQLTEMYPSTFTKHFRDTVDILVGWHIDGTQKCHITNYASRSLQRLSRFWVADMQFSLTLLSQFLEDMEAYGEDLTLPSSGRSSPTDEPPLTPEQCVAKITSLIKVFNTVLKCLGQHLSPVLSPAISWSFLINCFTKMLQTVLKVLEIHVKEDLIMAANECACLLLTYLQSKTSSGNVKLYLLIETELSVVPQLGEEALISMLRMIAKAVREVSANLPIELVQQILGPTSAILQLRFSSSLSVQNEVVAVYQSLLNLKNIPPLQEAYRYVLGDLEIAYRMIVPSMPELCQVNPHLDTKYTLNDAEIVVMFHLRSLADLANASNSIIGMWALKPSILELLAVKLQPYDENLMMYSPALLYALLYLLYSHCARYNHFVSSSFLVSANHGMTNVCDMLRLPLARDADVPATSPTSGHFSIILNLLSRILSQGACEEVLHLVLSWTQELLLQAITYLSVLQQTPEFTKLINAIILTGHTSVPSIAFSVLDNLEQLLSAGGISWEIFSDVVDLCILHLNSTDSQVGQKVCKLLTLIPWHVTVIKLATVAEQKKKANSKPDSFTVETVDLIQRHHLARGTYGEIQPQQFRKFMGYLLQGIHYSDREWLEDMFCSCWPVNPPKQTDDEKTASLFPKFALASNTVLLLWATWEAAQFCVTYKLRTPLGKPQDTFTSIEGAIKSLARELSLSQNNIDDVHPAVEVEGSFWRQQRVRLLVEFVEHLEKATHNAAEGSATAMLPSPKPVRMFFHTNKSTCAEWLTRIRLAVMVVALHAGLATAAVRHGHCLLQDLVDANNIQGTEFERAVMYTCWALCKLNEPEAIQGLYAWCRELGRKFVWLKAAAEQACGKYEAAGEDYRKLLYQECSNVQSPTHLPIDENSSSVVEKQPEQHVNGFLAGQLTECYMAVNNWTDLVEWKEKEQELWNKFTSGEMPQKYWLNNMSPSHIKALAEIEENKFSALAELEKWDSAEKEDALFGMDRHWSCYKLTGHVYSALFDVAINLAAQGPIEEREENDNAVLSEKLEACLRISRCQLQEGLRNVPSEFLQDCAVAQYAATGLQALLQGHPIRNPFSVMDKQLSIDSMNTSVLTKILWWGKYFDHMSASGESLHYNHSNQLRMEVARKARKEGNFNLAQNLLVKIFGSEEGLLFRKKLIFNEVAQNLIQTNSGQLWNSDLARACMEIAKLLYSSDSHEKAIQVCAVSALGVMQQPANIEPDLKERGARTMLTLAKWLQLESHLISDVGDKLAHLLAWEDTQLNKDMLQFGSLNIDHCSPLLQNGTNVIPAADAMVGRLLHKSVSLCPSLAKCWSQFAAWCYRWGRRVVDAASETGGQLSEGDRAGVKRLLPSGMPLQDLEKVYTILSQTRTGADEEDIENEDINTSEMIESQLQNVQTLNQATSEQLTHLVDIWRGAQKRIYIYYELSAVAYFKYLELCGDKEGGDCATITATLRLLRLIVKHALELQEVLESGLGTTPTRPWKGIIPQLFSRLSHPEPYVRRRVSELLCRVAEDAPHLITFPAVVGAAAGGARLRDMNIATTTARLFSTCLSQRSEEGDLEDEEEEEEEEEEEDDECSNEVDSQVSVLKNCFLAMVDTLSKQAPDAISQVQLLVQELRRITLLWDELWLGTLAQHHAEISRRLSQLELEILKVDNNVSLSAEEKEWLVAEKHRIILKPLFFVLEQLHAITSVTPETPHEKWFQQKFGEYITDALQKLKHPTNPRRPQESWQPMKQLQSKLQQRAQKRGAYMIRMTDVSPALAALKDTLIAMPGINSHSDQIITVASVDNNIAILPTKTKPKKIAFHGCDGQMYTYLFKGLEDLHLDERIMQFLSIANTMMHQKGSSSQVYQARHYSVIPLGPRSGLISWVDGVTPLFGLYKRWQQREAALTTIKNQSSSGTQPSAPSPVMRPSELFYSKLTPYLKERGITNLDNRKEWPHAVLKQVLTELMEETPKDLLAKELWCHSINSGSWWQATRTYSYSVAVMSIIGYIIGLGDRHLDNVLVDLSTGEVVHIDYNVCFEKGKTLRVPEKVPFRMTPNICTALGVTGVEGIFRLACEHVLKIMKKGRETLLTLLEAFVYDPLIDWTPGNEAGYTGAVYGGGQEVAMETKQSRKELEREVTVAMFCVRVAEMKADWLKNRDELLAALPELEEKLSKWLKEQGHIKEVQEALQDFHQQMALVKEAEAVGPSGQHPLYSLAARFSKHRRARDAQEKAKTGLREKLADCEKHLSLHKVALASVRGPQLAQWVAELNYPVEKDSHLVFDLVKEFLQNAGQGQMIMQCGQSECELGQLAQQQNMLIRTCLDLLSQYGAVAGLYPASYLNTHRSMCYLQWVQVLLGDMTVERCQEVRAQFQSIFSADALNNNPANQQIIAFSYQLQGALQEANVRFKKSFERLTAEGLPESSVRLEAAYMEAREAITKFLHGEPGAAIALECVIITALCTLNKRLLMMEAAAASAGDCLVDLTSREGDWFLDEMYLVSTLVTELATLLPLPHNPTSVQLVLQCLKSANSIYKGLQELNFNFHTIILPEALKTIQTEEPTVLVMVQELDDIIAGVGCPLPELLVQLEMHLRFVIMEMESPHSNAQSLVSALRTKYEALLLHPSDPVSEGDETLKPGQMLLMGFNGLFEKLQLEGSALISALETLETPACWKKVDQVREAKTLAAPVFSDATRAVLEDIFLLKRLQTMQEFFLLCSQMTRCPANMHDDDQLNKPIRRFTADYVSRQLLGVTSQTLALALCLLLQRIGLNVTVEVEQRDIGAESKVPLEELCHKAVDLCLKRGHLSTGVLAQASGLTSSMEVAWRQREVALHLQQEVEGKRATLQRLQLQLTAYHWLYEDVLAHAHGPVLPLSRPSFMLELRKTSSALLALQARLSEAQEQQNNLVSNVEQRLKWAAGVNPALNEVMAAFESAVTYRNERLAMEQELAALVGNTCSALLHHEALRTRTSEAVAHDTAFLQLLDQCEKSCVLMDGLDQGVTAAEESLMQLLPPEGPIDHSWIQNAEILISDKVKTLQEQLIKYQQSLVDTQENLKKQVLAVRSLFSAHHKLMLEVRSLLKSMAKFEDGGLAGLHEYLSGCRMYSEQFSSVIRDLMADEIDVDRVHSAMEQLQSLKERTSKIYEELLLFGKLQQTGGSIEEKSRRPPLLRQESVCFSPRKGVPGQDPRTGKAVQERNAYALGVWRRVRMKLEGRDPDPGRRATVQEQVEYVIHEAMSLDNLALLYEGWTPWV